MRAPSHSLRFRTVLAWLPFPLLATGCSLDGGSSSRSIDSAIQRYEQMHDKQRGKNSVRLARNEPRAAIPETGRVDHDSTHASHDAQDALSVGPLPGFWETVKRDIEAAPADLWSDTKAVYGDGRNLLILGVTYGGSLALQQAGADDAIEDTLGDGRIFSGDFADGFGAVGNPATHFGLAGLWYLMGQQRQDDKTYEVGKTLFSALIINGLSTTVGKLATWDKSPNGEYFAFPSGHTSSSFTVASVLHEAYGPWVGVPLYAVSTMVAVERLDSGEHYLSDVVMGGVMGLVIGHTVAGEHPIEVFGGRIVPYADPRNGATGVAWHYEF